MLGPSDAGCDERTLSTRRNRQFDRGPGADRPLAYPGEIAFDALLAADRDGLALGWQATDDEAVTPSPDTGSSGNRAQRLRSVERTRESLK